MSSCIVQIFSSRAKILVLCVVSVLAAVSCASQGGSTAAVSYDMAKVYLVEQGPVSGQSGDFWTDLEGTVVNRHPWIGSAADATGVFKFAVDAKNLYVRAEIKDSAPQLRPVDMNPADSWNGTSIQFFFGVNTKRHAEYEEGDSSVSFWVTQGEGDELKVVASKGRLLNERQCKTAVVEWNEDSYVIEASISLDALNIYKPLKANQNIRCEFRINHAKVGEDRTVIVNWRTTTDDAWKNPNTWSDGIVVKK